MVGFFQKRQVVHGVGVESHLHIPPVQAFLTQPLRDAGDFALAKGRCAPDLARDPATGIAFQLHRDQLADPESLGNRAGHKFVGGGHDHHRVARMLVRSYQRQRLGRDAGPDHFVHVAGMRLGRLGGTTLAGGAGGKPHVIVDVERARLVVGIKLVIALAEHRRVGPAQFGGEHAPGVVGVQRQQGVVQVKQREFHSFSSIARTSGMVRARCVCKA
jgi:hypothetical protein